MAVIGNAPFQGLVSGGEILDASIEGVDLSTSAIAARLGYTPVNPAAAAITGGTINGTTIGATTATSGAFTTVAASGAVTLSGGTANGVPYLNGSKVVTTGSALTFDGTNLGIGASTPADALNVGTAKKFRATHSASVYQQIFSTASGNFLNAIGDNFQINADVGAIYLTTVASQPIVFQTNNEDRVKILGNGNVGIGTSSPTGYLANKLVINTGTDSNNGITIASASNRNGSIWFADGTTGNQSYRGGIDYTHVSDSLIFYAAAQGNMVLDASGNLGLGVTPSAWSVGKAIEIGNVGNAVWCVSATQITMPQNAYFNGAWRYGANGFATRYAQESGVHQWWNAPTGTAGNTVTFTQAMTLEADGDLALGKTSASYRFDLQGAAGENQTLAGFFGGTNTARGLTLGLSAGGTGANDAFAVYNATLGGGYSGHIWQAGGAEQARINQNGYLGIGTNNPLNLLHIASASSNKVEFLRLQSTSGFDAAGGSFIRAGSSGNNSVLFGFDYDSQSFQVQNGNTNAALLTVGTGGTVTINNGGLNLGAGGTNGYISGGTWYGINSGNWSFQAGNGSQNFIWKNSSGSSLMTLDTSGRLLVGTTNASGARIRGLGATNTNAYYYLDADGPFGGSPSYSSVLGFALYTDSGTRQNSQAEIKCIADSNYSGSLAFSTQNPGTYPNTVTERMRIASGGRVGIGTADPYGNLSVFMGTTAPQDLFYYDNVNMLQLGESSARGLAGLFAKRSTFAGANGFDGDLAFYNLFYAGGADYQWKERMRIQANGNVGIGITTPASPLHVKTGGTTFNIPTNNAIGGGTAGRVHFIGTEPGLMFSSDMNTANAVSTGTGTLSLGLQIGYYGANDVRSQLFWAGSSPLTFTYASSPTASPEERMRIATNGNVGIGTTSTSNYKLAVESSNASFLGYFTNTNTGTGAQGLAVTMNADNGAYKYNWEYGATLYLSNDRYQTSGIVSKLVMNTANGGYNSGAIIHVEGAGGYNQGQLVFSTGWNSSGLGTERMRINASGNLGIGTPNPVADNKLTVDNGANSYGLIINSSASPGLKLSVNGTNNTFIVGDATSLTAEHLNQIMLRTNDANRARLTSTGDLQLYTGNLVISTAGKGIDFSADPNAAGMTSELLDDYEEGTWTPVLAGLSTAGSVAYTYQIGHYTKIGRLVYLWFDLDVSSFSGGAGALVVLGSPFTNANISTYYPIFQPWQVASGYGTTYTTPTGFMDPNSSIIRMYTVDDGHALFSPMSVNQTGRISGYLVVQAA